VNALAGRLELRETQVGKPARCILANRAADGFVRCSSRLRKVTGPEAIAEASVGHDAPGRPNAGLGCAEAMGLVAGAVDLKAIATWIAGAGHPAEDNLLSLLSCACFNDR
tara:strand:- start:416 stop:745 length:330 start_codon:yes stop_codon:yes gene_type:complete